MNELEMINALITAGHSGSLEEIKTKLERPKKRENWRPKLDESYYFIDGGGFVTPGWNGGHLIDRFRIGTGNYYRTKEDAEMALKIINRIIDLRGDWTPDWNNCKQEKCVVYYDHTSEMWQYFYYSYQETLGVFYLPIGAAAQTLIDEFGDELFLISGRI